MRHGVLTAALLLPTTGLGQTILSGTYMTPNGVSDQGTLCSGQTAFPPEWTWQSTRVVPPPRSATVADNLIPRIDQHRIINATDTIVASWRSFASNPQTCHEIWLTPPAAGQPEPIYTPAQLEAMARMGCGPFGDISGTDLFRLWQPGDTFYVHPAVYTGLYNDISIYPQTDWYAESVPIPLFVPTNITIRGLTRNGIRPVLYRNDSGDGDSRTTMGAVYIDETLGFTLDNIDVVLGPQGWVYKGLVYDVAGGYSDRDQYGNPVSTPTFGATTISNARIMGGEQVSGGVNGIFGADNVAGTLNLVALELAYNGGSNGPAHNAYLPTSPVDPNFTVVAEENYSHDVVYGMLFKTRAQRNIIRRNYFQGGVPQPGQTMAEAYDLDISNGGVAVIDSNIFTKTMSGAESNGVSIAYAYEGVPDNRTLKLRIHHNTFWAFSLTYDGFHPLVPWGFFIPNQVPGAVGFPVQNPVIEFNAFGGYCPTGNPGSDFRGNTALLAGFADVTRAFSFNDLWESADQSIIGNLAYLHMNQAIGRTDASIGAED